MNAGKVFETNFKVSIPEDMFYYRFRDGTGGFDGQKNENVRFQHSNICDCMIFTYGKLFLLELKSHKGKSLPFKAIRENQIKELKKADEYNDIIAGLVVNFRDIEKTYFVDIKNVLDYMKETDRKSLPLEFFILEGIEIESKKIRVNYRYDIKTFIGHYFIRTEEKHIKKTQKGI